MTSLKQRLLTADLGLTESDFDGHATDLYVRAKPGVMEWLKDNYTYWRNITTFTPQWSTLPPDMQAMGLTEVWLDIPFARGRG